MPAVALKLTEIDIPEGNKICTIVHLHQIIVCVCVFFFFCFFFLSGYCSKDYILPFIRPSICTVELYSSNKLFKKSCSKSITQMDLHTYICRT